jgi:hypothetical protein
MFTRLLAAAVAALILVDATRTASAAELKWKTGENHGSESPWGHKVRLYSFTFNGDFSNDSIKGEVADVIEKVEKENLCAERFDIPENQRHAEIPHGYAFGIGKGEVCVIGWVDETTENKGWLAAKSDGGAYPKFHWLSSGGKEGTIDSSQMSNDPAKAYVTRSWDNGGERQVEMRLAADAGWITWFANFEGDSP